MSKSTEVLLLGSGWTASFLLPLLKHNSISYAYTSRSPPTSDEAKRGKLQFELPDKVTKASLRCLPSARTVVIIFPIKDLDQVHDLVDLYEAVHGPTRWIQLGSTGIWGTGHHTSASPFDRENVRAAAEQRLLDVTNKPNNPHSRSAVLNLAGLYGDLRQPVNFAARVGATKDMLAVKGSVHFIHGKDVARAILFMHQSAKRGWGKRWIISDGKIYDWWQLFRFLKPKLADHSQEESGKLAEQWVRELMQSNNVHSLPRPLSSKTGQHKPQYLERSLDGQEFWEMFGTKPEVDSAYTGADHNEASIKDSFSEKTDEKAGSKGHSFHVRDFDPTIPQEQIEALIERLEIDNQRPLPAETEFEGDYEHFGLTHQKFIELRDAWIPFLRSESSEKHLASSASSSASSFSSSSSPGRLGPDHDSWAADQARICSFSHHKVQIEDVDLHFIHERANLPAYPALGTKIIPLLLLHGWPGSFHEFLDVIKPLAHPGILAKIHFDVVVPSHPGYLFSSRPQHTSRDSKTGKIVGQHSGPNGDIIIKDVARIMDKLMRGLGYNHYAIQAGDWGSVVLREMALAYPSRVLACHLNFCPSVAPAVTLPLVGRRFTPDWLSTLPQSVSKERYIKPSLGLLPHKLSKLGDAAWRTTHLLSLGGVPPPPSAAERERMVRGIEFVSTGYAYAATHSTRPSTLGLALSRSPLATLSWIGEKFYAWTDQDPPLSVILASLTLYEVTETMPRSIYPYRNRDPRGPAAIASDPRKYITQPTGFSDFPYEINPVPKSFVQASVNLRWYKSHDKGGHFAALENPDLFVKDVADCLGQIWPR